MAYIKCTNCGTTFDLDLYDPFCPNCKHNNASKDNSEPNEKRTPKILELQQGMRKMRKTLPAYNKFIMEEKLIYTPINYAIPPARSRQFESNKLFKKAPGPLLPLEKDELNSAAWPAWMTRVYRNNRYTVMINDNKETTHGKAICAMVQKHNDSPILNHWAEMQNIKNEIFGHEATAVEYYPAESQLTNANNIYWLWVFPDGVLPLIKH